MYNFFAQNGKVNGEYLITGGDFNHIKNVLRMREGDNLLVSFNGVSDLCRIKSFLVDTAVCEVVEENCVSSELPITIHLFQGLPKADKLELIIQKAVELGVNEITPTEMHRSIVRIDAKKEDKKVLRWQAICESAAKQSKRNVIPKINAPKTLKQTLNLLKDYNHVLVPYESLYGMEPTKNSLSKIKKGDKIALFIGPEGGFENSEIELLKGASAETISLGKRILRTETASITALSMLMLYAELNI